MLDLSGLQPNPQGFVRVECPLCPVSHGSPDKKHSVRANVKTGWFKCYRCGEQGRVQDLDEYEDWQPKEDTSKSVECTLPEGFVLLDSEEGRQAFSLRPAWDYLKSRGISERFIVEAKVGACAHGLYRNRVVVPVYDEGALKTWVSRRWTAKPSDYRNSPDPRFGVIFNGAALDVETDLPCLVVEGCFDTAPFWPDAVALLGGEDEAQVARMARAKRPILVVPDGDAWRKGEALALRLQLLGSRAWWLRLPPKGDPDEFVEDILEAREKWQRKLQRGS